MASTVQKSICKAFGNEDNYASEKEEQQAIYEELQWKKNFHPPSP
jgi:hypothetical protein